MCFTIDAPCPPPAHWIVLVILRWAYAVVPRHGYIWHRASVANCFTYTLLCISTFTVGWNSVVPRHLAIPWDRIISCHHERLLSGYFRMELYYVQQQGFWTRLNFSTFRVSFAERVIGEDCACPFPTTINNHPPSMCCAYLDTTNNSADCS